MADPQTTSRDTLPKLGRVNEVCRQWLVREDGALAYRLQNEEISEHYTGNKYRNAQVREDFPCALDEQIREQRLAEQAAALYHQMITEQEEQDAQVAKQLADKMKQEELAKKRALEQEDEEIAKQLLERERLKQLEKQQRLLAQQQSVQSVQNVSHRHHLEQHSLINHSPNYSPNHSSKHSPRKAEYSGYESPRKADYQESSKRQGYLMPLPTDTHTQPSSSTHYLTSSDNIVDSLQQCAISDALELGLPVDEVDERRIQEERDRELARKLQEQESSAEEIQLNRDRLLAIEAQDKELAKLLQERERAKVRRAKERARQKALAKKQQMELNPDQILPDDSYSNPVDLLQHPECSHTHTQNYKIPLQSYQPPEDDVNYSLPVDVLPKTFDHNLKQNYSPQKNYDSRLNGYNRSEIRGLNGSPSGINSNIAGSYVGNVGTSSLAGSHLATGLAGNSNSLMLEREIPAIRPTQLDLKNPITKSVKAVLSDPNSIEICDPIQGDSSYSHHANIAMAIDPTYTRRSNSHSHSHTPSSQDTSTLSTSTSTSSTTGTSTSTSTASPATLPPPDLSEDEVSPVPPYMPIQGQRRTASLEKKKKRAKDGCKQQ